MSTRELSSMVAGIESAANMRVAVPVGEAAARRTALKALSRSPSSRGGCIRLARARACGCRQRGRSSSVHACDARGDARPRGARLPDDDDSVAGSTVELTKMRRSSTIRTSSKHGHAARRRGQERTTRALEEPLYSEPAHRRHGLSQRATDTKSGLARRSSAIATSSPLLRSAAPEEGHLVVHRHLVHLDLLVLLAAGRGARRRIGRRSACASRRG